MKCTPLMMFVKPVLEFFLFAFVGLYEAAPRVNENDASPVGKELRTVSETTSKPLYSTTMPNHLPEDKFGGVTFSALTPAPTTASVGTPGNILQLETTTAQITTATTAHTATMGPFTNSGKVATTATAKQTTGLFHSPSVTKTSSSNSTAVKTKLQNTTVVPERTTNSWSSKSTSPLLIPTEHRQEPQCNCSGEGVLDPDGCEEVTGRCSCLPGFAGPQCEACEPGHFSNSSTACLPCGCDTFGAVDRLCDSSGICTCKTGVYGPKCDECHPGYFRFSSTGCQPCQCNQHSNNCHPQSGICLNCQDNTKGPSCEECKYNFYRRPGDTSADVCIPCPCSTVTSTGSCHIDFSGRPVCDQCRPEYQGPNCDRCRDGFYNSDSLCLPCDCSGNADPLSLPRVCHPDTGRCLSCANNTAGPRCQHCASGFSGDALAHNCTPTAVEVLPTSDPRGTSTATKPRTTSPAHHSLSSTMSSRVNSTSLFTTVTTQALLTGLAGPTGNSTAAITEVSWTQFNVIVLAVIIVVVLLLLGFVGGVYAYREYQNRKLNAPFWTIELKEDNISFSSYHDSIPNADVSGLLEDEANEVASNGQLALNTPINMYKA